MSQPIYSINLIQSDDGTHAKVATGYSGSVAPLGGSFTDLWRKNRAPSAQELIQNLVGYAYACASLNSDGVASNQFGLFVRTRPGEKKTRWRTAPVTIKTLKRLKSAGIVSGDIRRTKSEAQDGFVAGDTEVQEITDENHPLKRLLNKPEPDAGEIGLSGYDLRHCSQLFLESIGRAYWWIDRDGFGVPTRIWLLRSHLVKEVYTQAGEFSHYEYGQQKFSIDQIIKFHFPDPNNPYVNGYGPMMAAIEKIRIARKEDAHINALLDNMGRPDAIWSPKGDSEGGGIGAAEARRATLAFRQQYSMAGRGGVMVSELPGTLETLGWQPQDIVEIERAKAIKTDVLNCFGVPDAKLERNSANLASAKTADYAHAKDAILPRLRRIEETWNARLVPLFDNSGRMFVAFDSPVPEDEAFEAEQSRNGMQSGSITRNEHRASMDYDPVPWGDQPLVVNTMVEVDPVTGKPVLPPPPTPTLVKPKDNGGAIEALAASVAKMVETLAAQKHDEQLVERLENRDLRKRLRKARKELKRSKQDGINGTATSTNGITTADIAAAPATSANPATGPIGNAGDAVRIPGVQADAITTRGTHVDSGAISIGRIGSDGKAGPLPQGHDLALAIREVYGNLCAKVLHKLKDASELPIVTKDDDRHEEPPAEPKPLPTVTEWFEVTDWTKTLATAAAPYLEASAKLAVTELAGKLGVGISFDVIDRNLSKAISEQAMKFAEETLDTTTKELTTAVDELRAELEQGIVEGDTRQELTSRVQKVFEDIDKSRAETIAQTETSRAIHDAEQMTAKESGVVKTKAWLASADACPICEAFASIGPIALDKSFGPSSDKYGPINGPPAHPRCQCSETFGLKDLSEVEVFAPAIEGEIQVEPR